MSIVKARKSFESSIFIVSMNCYCSKGKYSWTPVSCVRYNYIGYTDRSKVSLKNLLVVLMPYLFKIPLEVLRLIIDSHLSL